MTSQLVLIPPGPEVVAELAAEFRSEQDYLGECNKNRLLAAVAHAAIRRRSAQGIRAWMSRSGDSIQRRNWWWNKLQFLFDLLRYKRSAPKQDSIYKRRSTGNTKVALTDTIYDKLYDQRDQSARERGYSSSGEAKSSPLLIEPSVRRSSSTCYEAPVFGGSRLLDLERRTSGQGKAQCAWCKWLSSFFFA
ncbi:hypothetical protein Ddye_010823 [Dipteronia dyeriana]|uniref:Uncharacterized protein n=1 Tax=Dipteronia dyeriana TaxID=168575 RepID=A0AAD9XEL0_9ROSI|nr:hypothetical protein Ddye_010823 [Dipteronia dyeriana]